MINFEKIKHEANNNMLLDAILKNQQDINKEFDKLWESYSNSTVILEKKRIMENKLFEGFKQYFEAQDFNITSNKTSIVAKYNNFEVILEKNDIETFYLGIKSHDYNNSIIIEESEESIKSYPYIEIQEDDDLEIAKEKLSKLEKQLSETKELHKDLSKIDFIYKFYQHEEEYKTPKDVFDQIAI